MIDIACAIVIIAGLWLIAIGVVMAVRPQRALQLLAKTASSQRANLLEQVPRLIVGFALIVSAGVSRVPLLFHYGGWFIVISSAALIVIPLKWHAGYAIWWAGRLSTGWVRAVAPLSLLFGGWLIVAVLGSR